MAAFQDAASVSSVWHFARNVHIQYCMHFFSFQLSPFLIVNGLRLEIQIRLLAVVILVFGNIRLMTVQCNFVMLHFKGSVYKLGICTCSSLFVPRTGILEAPPFT